MCVCVCVCVRHVCEVLQVSSPHSSANGAPAVNGHAKAAGGGDSIVISDSDEESSAFQSPKSNGSVGSEGSEGSEDQRVRGSKIDRCTERLKSENITEKISCFLKNNSEYF